MMSSVSISSLKLLHIVIIVLSCSLLLSSFVVVVEGAIRGVNTRRRRPDNDIIIMEEDDDMILKERQRYLQVQKKKEKVALTDTLTYQRGGAAGNSRRSMTSSRGSSMMSSMTGSSGSSSSGSSSSSTDFVGDLPMCIVASTSTTIDNTAMVMFLDEIPRTVMCGPIMGIMTFSVSCELDTMTDGFALVQSIVGLGVASDAGQCVWQCLNSNGCTGGMNGITFTTELRCCTDLQVETVS